MSILRKMEQAAARIQIASIREFILDWDLDNKFKIVVAAPWAEPLAYVVWNQKLNTRLSKFKEAAKLE